MDIAQLVTVLTQLGVAAAAWRLASKIEKRLVTHEALDTAFHLETKTLLKAQDSAFEQHRAAGREFQDSLRVYLGMAGR